MSTYYYLICEDCKERTDAASRIINNIYSSFGYGDKTLLPFIISHLGCSVEIIDENDNRSYGSVGDMYKEWNMSNWSDMIKLAAKRGNWA